LPPLSLQLAILDLPQLPPIPSFGPLTKFSLQAWGPEADPGEPGVKLYKLIERMHAASIEENVVVQHFLV